MRGLGMTALLLASSLMLAACGDEDGTTAPKAGTPPADTETARLDEHRSLGAPIIVENLTVWPVYTDAPLDVGEFLTLQEAQKEELAVVREVGDGNAGQQRIMPNDASNDEPQPPPAREGSDLPGQLRRVGGGSNAATVNKVVIENKGDLPILVCAGTIIQGGKQDRQIGQDYVILAGKTVEVDAFCVEKGRWALQTAAEHEGLVERGGEGVAGGGAARIVRKFSSFRVAPPSVRAAGQYAQDQDKVWAKVRVSNQELMAEGANNDSDTLFGAIELADEETKAKRLRIEKDIAEAFERLATSQRKPIGFAYAVNGRPVNVRAFAHERILRSQLPFFLTSMAMDALVGAKDAKNAEPVSASDMIAFVRAIEAAKEKMVETRAANFNGYFANDTGFKARCYLKKDGRVPVGPDRIVITEDWTRK